MKSETPARPRASKTPKRRETLLRGIPVSPGIAIGPAFDTSEAPAEAPRRSITTEAIVAERVRLADAVAFSRKQVTKLKTRIGILPE
jgi:phosphotransferase system enzyme I (PtsI)